MKKLVLKKFVIPLLVITLVGLLAAVVVVSKEKEMTGNEILKTVAFFNQAKDQTSKMTMILIDKNGDEIRKEMDVWGKGDHMRLIKFTYPADIKGTGFLVQDADLDTEKMYIYLSAFKKTKRIAGSAKGESFMESDFSYDDMGSFRYDEHYDAKRLKDKEGIFVLELKKKEKSEKEFEQLVLWVSMESRVPLRVEFYDLKKIGKEEKLELKKILTTDNAKKISGYWIPTVLVMEDVKKKHMSKLIFKDLKFDTGLSDSIFTERYLER